MNARIKIIDIKYFEIHLNFLIISEDLCKLKRSNHLFFLGQLFKRNNF